MKLQQAIELVKAHGYRLSKPKTKAEPPRLNAIGRPYSSQYDPNYRMKYKPRKYAPSGGSVGPGISPERWAAMCAAAKAEWDARMGVA